MIQIFIVFHKNIFDECYKNIPQDILDKYFTFIAVNENIRKIYSKKYKVINEWELPIYNSIFQERGYNENSAIYHVYANNLHKPYKSIGFFQYDMKFNNLKIGSLNKIYYYKNHDFNLCSYKTWNEQNTLDFIIKDYEHFYQSSFSKEKQYPLYNSFIIPVETYEKIMKWVIQLYDKLYPWCIQPPNNTHFAHIGGIYERVMGYAIGQENLEQIPLNITHNHNLKKKSYSY